MFYKFFLFIILILSFFYWKDKFLVIFYSVKEKFLGNMFFIVLIYVFKEGKGYNYWVYFI